eukprot:gene4167-5931_t
MDHHSNARPTLPGTTPTPSILGRPNVYSPQSIPNIQTKFDQSVKLNKSLIFSNNDDLNNSNGTMVISDIANQEETAMEYNSSPIKRAVNDEINMTSTRLIQQKMLNKAISKLPFQIRESISSIIGMIISNSEKVQKDLTIFQHEVGLLKSELVKKGNEVKTIQKTCDIYQTRLRQSEDIIDSLKDTIDYNQNSSIKNKSAMSRLATTNRMLIDSLDALDSHNNNKTITTDNNNANNNNSCLRSQSNPNLSKGRPRLLAPITSEGTTDKNLTTAQDMEAKMNAFQNDKLRESLLRVAREHYRSMKNAETLEFKVQELRGKLRLSEQQNRKLKSELDEIRSLNDASGDAYSDRFMSNDIPPTPKQKSFGEIDKRFRALIDKNGFDPIDGIAMLRRILSHFASSPNTLEVKDMISHIVSRETMKIFDTSMICLFVIQPGSPNNLLKYTARSLEHPDIIDMNETISIAGDTLKHGQIDRINVLSQSILFNPKVDGCDGVTTKRIISFPVVDHETHEVIGAVHLLNKGEHNEVFTDVDELFGLIFADQASLLLTSSVKYDRLRYRAEILQSLLESSTALFAVIPEPNSLPLNKSLLPGEILTLLESTSRECLKCVDTRAFLVSDYIGMSPGELVYLDHNANKMSSIPKHVAMQSLKTTSLDSSIAGVVIKTRMMYQLENPTGFDPYLNPLVDIDPVNLVMVTVPIMDLYGTVVGCIQLVAGKNSPNVRPTNDISRENKILFAQACEWLAHQIATPLQYLLRFVGRTVNRPISTPQSITLGPGALGGSVSQVNDSKRPLSFFIPSGGDSRSGSRSGVRTIIPNSEMTITTNAGNRSRSQSQDFESIPVAFTPTKAKMNSNAFREEDDDIINMKNNYDKLMKQWTIEKEDLLNEKNSIINEKDELKTKVEIMKLEIESQVQKMNELMKENERMKKENNDLKSQENSNDERASSQILQLNLELDMLRNELTENKQQFSKEMNNVNEQLKASLEKYSILNNELIQSNNLNSSLQHEKSQLNQLNNTLTDEIDQLKQLNQQKLDETARMNQSLEEEKKVLLNKLVEKEKLQAILQDQLVKMAGDKVKGLNQELIQNKSGVGKGGMLTEGADGSIDERTFVSSVSYGADSMMSNNVISSNGSEIKDVTFISPLASPNTASSVNNPQQTSFFPPNNAAIGIADIQNNNGSNSMHSLNNPKKIDKIGSSASSLESSVSKILNIESNKERATGDTFPMISTTEGSIHSDNNNDNKSINSSIAGGGVPSSIISRPSTKGLPPPSSESSRMSLGPPPKAPLPSSRRPSLTGENPNPNTISSKIGTINSPTSPITNNASGPPLPQDWVETMDEYGQVYYYNNVTGESSWFHPEDAPKEFVRKGNWIQQFDENFQEYWVNELTGESAWEIPDAEQEAGIISVNNDIHHSAEIIAGGSSTYAATAGDYTIEL